ncbi:hypothetical protein ACK32Q_10185 [Aeromonas dhakensis]|uniref:hypothetical protein n=1 Tax=Aeromonas dhakensis TaxID=196024 RepID=UPI0039879209
MLNNTAISVEQQVHSINTTADVSHAATYLSFSQVLGVNWSDENIKYTIEPLANELIKNNSTKKNNIFIQRSSVADAGHLDSFEEFRKLSDEKCSQFISIFKNDEYFDGEISKTQMFFDTLYNSSPFIFYEVFSFGWTYAFKKLSPAKLSDFICVAASIDYEILKHHADALIVGAWSHSDLQVKDSVLRAIESWGVKEHSFYLDKMQVADDIHVENYRRKIINWLKDK